MDILTWQEVLTQTVSLMGNKEQNLFFPPYIASNAGRLVTNYILDELVRVYPNSQIITDKARPFLKRKIVSVENGIGNYPSDYRNILDMGIAVNDTHTSPCNCSEEQIEQTRECKDCTENNELINTTDSNSILYDATLASLRKEWCKFTQVVQVDVDQFYKRTSSKLRPPTFEKPVYTNISRTQFKLCPIGVTHVEIFYIKDPVKSNIAYTMMPDDTWQINTADPTFVELEWEVSIAPEFFRAFTTLYSIHTRDGSLVNALNELKQLGLF